MSESKRINWDLEYPISKIEFKNFHKYPLLKRFLEITDPPKEIYYRGTFPGEHFHFLAVVGSRNITNYGADAIKKIIDGLRGQNICIISGLALGVDGAAHVLALKNNLPTIGVPGSGLNEDVIYPKTNKKIAENILLSGGLLLSEFPPEHPSLPFTFPARNRIMAAMSDAVLIIEAAAKSGSLITASLAIDYNKDVLCVPGPINSENSYGTNKLIANGAKLVQDSNDVLDQFRITFVEDFGAAPTAPLPGDLSDVEKKILTHLKEPKTKDSLMQDLEIDIGEFLTAITILEMKGYTKEDVGIIRRVR